MLTNRCRHRLETTYPHNPALLRPELENFDLDVSVCILTLRCNIDRILLEVDRHRGQVCVGERDVVYCS